MTAVLITLALMLLAYELNAWFPTILRNMIEIAVVRLPKSKRAQFREEWHAHLDETPGGILKLWYCMGFVLASGRMFPQWRKRVSGIRSVRRGRRLAARLVRSFDLIIACAGLVALLPMLAFISWAIFIEDRGPILFVRRYVTRSGRPIRLYAFRSMRADCDASMKWASARDRDPRLTWIGRYMRRAGIDQIPALLNVARGDIGLIGPSPVPERFNDWINQNPNFDARLYEHPAFDKPGFLNPRFVEESFGISADNSHNHKPAKVLLRYLNFLGFAVLASLRSTAPKREEEAERNTDSLGED